MSNGFIENSEVDETVFLFTSESVGEGHPGNMLSSYKARRKSHFFDLIVIVYIN